MAAAIADYEKTIEIDPKYADAYNGAAYLIAKTDGDLEKALKYVNKALELEPGAESKLDTQGFVYYKMGDYQNALKIFSALLDDGYTYAYYGRGLVYEALGETENAISDYRRSWMKTPRIFKAKTPASILKTSKAKLQNVDDFSNDKLTAHPHWDGLFCILKLLH